VQPKFGAMDSPSQYRRALVTFDVNLGKDKGKHKIGIFEGDTPADVALKFCQHHSKTYLTYYF